MAKQFHTTFIPPLMVYLAAGLSGLTGIVGIFFIKEYLDLSASFIASLGFWAGIPWALKMPLGHLVDIIWRWKYLLVYVGASLIAASIFIMYNLVANTEAMAALGSVKAWYVLSVLLAPVGYALQDVVADAMTVEAVPVTDSDGNQLTEEAVKQSHTTMQTLGRASIIMGFILVAVLNISIFSDVETISDAAKTEKYANIYLLALLIPVISVAGVTLGELLKRQRDQNKIDPARHHSENVSAKSQRSDTKPNWTLFGGSFAFVFFTVSIGLSNIKFDQEIVFIGSMVIIIFLMRNLIVELPQETRGALIGTAIIIFVFRAMPLPGTGISWWEIDILGFDQQFLSVLSLITSSLTLVGILALRPFMATHTIAFVVFWLTIATTFLSLPNIGLFYGLHEWTSSWSNGVIDARFIAIFDTMLESPLGQISMIPMLAWIAKNAPPHLKATFFAVMASFTNLALSASSLGTKYLNEVFLITREVRDKETNAIVVAADYSQIGTLLITVAIITVIAPISTIVLVQNSRFRADQ
ncbi:MAG: hypothetical protein ACR2OJ_04200 [Hyphomicrobiales bacterium]